MKGYLSSTKRICNIAGGTALLVALSACGLQLSTPTKEEIFGRPDVKINEPHRRPEQQPSYAGAGEQPKWGPPSVRVEGAPAEMPMNGMPPVDPDTSLR